MTIKSHFTPTNHTFFRNIAIKNNFAVRIGKYIKPRSKLKYK